MILGTGNWRNSNDKQHLLNTSLHEIFPALVWKAWSIGIILPETITIFCEMEDTGPPGT